MTDPKLNYFVMDDTEGGIDFDVLAAFEATLDSTALAEAEQVATMTLGKAETADV